MSESECEDAVNDGIERGIKMAICLLPPANCLSIAIFSFMSMLTGINAINPKLASAYGHVLRRFFDDFNACDNDLGLDTELIAAIGDFTLENPCEQSKS